MGRFCARPTARAGRIINGPASILRKHRSRCAGELPSSPFDIRTIARPASPRNLGQREGLATVLSRRQHRVTAPIATASPAARPSPSSPVGPAAATGCERARPYGRRPRGPAPVRSHISLGYDARKRVSQCGSAQQASRPAIQLGRREVLERRRARDQQDVGRTG
jgi:hypothetical protein